MDKRNIFITGEINDRGLQCETLALDQTIGIQNKRIERFSYDTKSSYAVIK